MVSQSECEFFLSVKWIVFLFSLPKTLADELESRTGKEN